jgi:hypothetical protein
MKNKIKKAAKVIIKEAAETKKIDVPAKKSSNKQFTKAEKTMTLKKAKAIIAKKEKEKAKKNEKK